MSGRRQETSATADHTWGKLKHLFKCGICDVSRDTWWQKYKSLTSMKPALPLTTLGASSNISSNVESVMSVETPGGKNINH